MPFPLTIKFSKRLGHRLKPEDNPLVFDYLKDYLLKKRPTKFVTKNNVLEFDVVYDSERFFASRFTDKGEFTIIDNEDSSTVTYEIFLYEVFFVYGVLAIGVGGLSKSWLLCILFFIVTFGSNLLIAIVKNRLRFKRVITGIDSLIQQKNFTNI